MIANLGQDNNIDIADQVNNDQVIRVKKNNDDETIVEKAGKMIQDILDMFGEFEVRGDTVTISREGEKTTIITGPGGQETVTTGPFDFQTFWASIPPLVKYGTLGLGGLIVIRNLTR